VFRVGDANLSEEELKVGFDQMKQYLEKESEKEIEKEEEEEEGENLDKSISTLIDDCNNKRVEESRRDCSINICDIQIGEGIISFSAQLIGSDSQYDMDSLMFHLCDYHNYERLIAYDTVFWDDHDDYGDGEIEDEKRKRSLEFRKPSQFTSLFTIVAVNSRNDTILGISNPFSYSLQLISQPKMVKNLKSKKLKRSTPKKQRSTKDSYFQHHILLSNIHQLQIRVGRENGGKVNLSRIKLVSLTSKVEEDHHHQPVVQFWMRCENENGKHFFFEIEIPSTNCEISDNYSSSSIEISEDNLIIISIPLKPPSNLTFNHPSSITSNLECEIECEEAVEVKCKFCQTSILSTDQSLPPVTKLTPLPSGEFDSILHDVVCCEAPTMPLSSNDVAVNVGHLYVGSFLLKIHPSYVNSSNKFQELEQNGGGRILVNCRRCGGRIGITECHEEEEEEDNSHSCCVDDKKISLFQHAISISHHTNIIISSVVSYVGRLVWMVHRMEGVSTFNISSPSRVMTISLTSPIRLVQHDLFPLHSDSKNDLKWKRICDIKLIKDVNLDNITSNNQTLKENEENVRDELSKTEDEFIPTLQLLPFEFEELFDFISKFHVLLLDN